jgi:glutamate N-acetyltransferase/amino-acid N-acetyltransferase
MFYECPGGVTAPQGFSAAGVHAGVKKVKRDLALVYSQAPAVAAGVFTTSKVQAAPVIVDKLQLKRSSSFRAIVVNSGNANACTGERGLNDAWSMVRAAAHSLDIGEHEVFVSSTGVIGQYLPMENIEVGITHAVEMLGIDGHTAAAEAIMTTDKFTKELAVRTNIGGIDVVIGGMAKGSGMIAPNMATMLAFITTDVAIDQNLLQETLRDVVNRSFNRITVDGDTSTNDMVLVLANGAAGNTSLESIDDTGYPQFQEALEYVLTTLSKMIVMDGEGATKFIEITVSGAADEHTAVQAARAIANSSLVKTAIHGEDANWGRILAAIGYSGIEFDPDQVEIAFGSLPILRKNYVIEFSEQEAKKILSQKEIQINVRLNGGPASATFWTCDLSQLYVSINANYRT